MIPSKVPLSVRVAGRMGPIKGGGVSVMSI